ncbi:hypothetical protein PRK78_003502 [Emydomyces testavorans]|uniref:Uncharacterized protein n=1 Tax=Emydomyces testavorans TaxID=2070801 RepID=A0AAF0DGC1_9EURO|nr:hypothetical protein PRK78_003502 [Emydomyces testavorans]
MNRRASRNIGSEAYPSDDKPASIFQHYVGITLDRTQYEFATSRVISSGQDNGERKDFSAQSAKPRPHTSETIQLFCGDAANPSSWPKELQQAVSIAFSQEKSQYSSHAPEPERYVLALDSAYHFQPSRRPIFKYTHSVLHAHFLAFDIFLAPASSSRLRSFVNNFALRVLTPSLSAPFSNFVPPSAYKTQLRDAGYAEEDIAIEDITDDVFPGLARFLERRDQQLAALGLSGFLKWRISGWLFRWLSAGDILRAGIVVAKWKEKGLK